MGTAWRSGLKAPASIRLSDSRLATMRSRRSASSHTVPSSSIAGRLLVDHPVPQVGGHRPDGGQGAAQVVRHRPQQGRALLVHPLEHLHAGHLVAQPGPLLVRLLQPLVEGPDLALPGLRRPPAVGLGRHQHAHHQGHGQEDAQGHPVLPHVDLEGAVGPDEDQVEAGRGHHRGAGRGPRPADHARRHHRQHEEEGGRRAADVVPEGAEGAEHGQRPHRRPRPYPTTGHDRGGGNEPSTRDLCAFLTDRSAALSRP